MKSTLIVISCVLCFMESTAWTNPIDVHDKVLQYQKIVTEMQSLTTKNNISPQRLNAYGVGQLARVASNKTEEGRAKDRRVELVEQ